MVGAKEELEGGESRLNHSEAAVRGDAVLWPRIKTAPVPRTVTAAAAATSSSSRLFFPEIHFCAQARISLQLLFANLSIISPSVHQQRSEVYFVDHA